MLVSVYCINKGTPSEYYGLKNAEENTVLHFAPNNWKTEAGAKRWAQRNGFTVKEEKPMKFYHEHTPAEVVEILKREAEENVQ